MQSLPTNLTTDELYEIVNQLSELPTAQVTRTETTLKVTATKRKTGETVKVLSAVTPDGLLWHVMTVPGLLSATITAKA